MIIWRHLVVLIFLLSFVSGVSHGDDDLGSKKATLDHSLDLDGKGGPEGDIADLPSPTKAKLKKREKKREIKYKAWKKKKKKKKNKI